MALVWCVSTGRGPISCGGFATDGDCSTHPCTRYTDSVYLVHMETERVLPGSGHLLTPSEVADADGFVVDLCAGVGWAEGLSKLGVPEVGIELNDAACATRLAAGHDTIRGDIARLDPADFAGAFGLIASPPCQSFSTAGDGDGYEDPRGALVWEPLRWASVIRPEWIVLEQVQTVLPAWQVLAEAFRLLGYRIWTGTLDAANYGLPQNRRRAILIASRIGAALPPQPTHAEGASLLYEPWVSMADALGLEPGWSYDSGQNSVLGGGEVVRYVRSCDRPAGTLTTKAAGQWVLKHTDGRTRKVSVAEAARLQGFRPDLPWQGTREETLTQIGNAVPPPLAAAIVGSVIERKQVAA